jgi:hypothetical protein
LIPLESDELATDKDPSASRSSLSGLESRPFALMLMLTRTSGVGVCVEVLLGRRPVRKLGDFGSNRGLCGTDASPLPLELEVAVVDACPQVAGGTGLPLSTDPDVAPTLALIGQPLGVPFRFAPSICAVSIVPLRRGARGPIGGGGKGDAAVDAEVD